MGKTFSNLAELHRSFVLPMTGQRFVKRMEERDKEATRLNDHLYVGPHRKRIIRLTRFNALVAVPSDKGDGLIPMEITEAWDGQEFGRYATRFELRRSVLSTHSHVLSNSTVSSGGAGQSFLPIVEPSASADFLVVAHQGVVIGSDLVIPNSGPLVGDPSGAALRGIPFYVVPERYTIPDGWQSLGASHVTYKVVTLPDGRVIDLQQISSRGVEPLSERARALLQGDLLAAAFGYEVRDFLIEFAVTVFISRAMTPKRPMGTLPKVLSGPTKQIAAESVAAHEAASVARQLKIRNHLAHADTNLNHPVALQQTQPLSHAGSKPLVQPGSKPLPTGAGTLLTSEQVAIERNFKEFVRIERRGANHAERIAAYEADVKAEFRAFYEKVHQRPAPKSFGLPIKDAVNIIERVQAKWGIEPL